MRLRTDQRHVAGEHQDVVVAGDSLACALDGVAGAALLRLLHKGDAGRSYSHAHFLRLVADDSVNVVRRHDAVRCRDDVRQQRLAANLVQHLGPLRLQPRPFACRHDDDR